MICANCGAERPGHYCGHCGQNDRDFQRALPPLVGDLLKETFELDSRLLRTLKLLLFQPGELAAEFSRNRRASYVSPIRLYLFVSITFFFLLTLTTEISTIQEEQPQVRQELEAVADTDTERLLRAFGPDRVKKAQQILEQPDTSISRLLLLQLARGLEEDDRELDRVDVYWIGQVIDALDNPTSVFDQLLENLPIAIFILLPVYALLLQLFYFNRHRYYVEDLVFAVHLHTFAFIVFTLLIVLPEETGTLWLDRTVEWIASVLWFAIAVYHYLALKRCYGGGHVATFAKFSGLLLLYAALLTPAALTLLLLITLLTL